MHTQLVVQSVIFFHCPLDGSQEQDSYDEYDKYGYDIDAPTKERIGKQKGNAPRDNKKQNKQVDHLTRGKGKEFRHSFHKEITGQGLSLMR